MFNSQISKKKVINKKTRIWQNSDRVGLKYYRL